jgi:hypothetical protein
MKRDLYDRNVDWEPTLSDFEKLLLCHIIFRSRLSKEACTESNATIGRVLNKSPDRVSKVISELVSKEWIKNNTNYSEGANRRLELTGKTICMVKNEFKVWYLIRLVDFNYPPFKERHLKSLINEADLISIKEKSIYSEIPYFLKE